MSSAAPMRFVVLEHSWNGVHYDLMLERDGLLTTWRLAAIPDEREQEATQLPDHRSAYLDYEGPVSGGRGTVSRVTAGTYTVLSRDERSIRLRLASEKLTGELTLIREHGTRWTARFIHGC